MHLCFFVVAVFNVDFCKKKSTLLFSQNLLHELKYFLKDEFDSFSCSFPRFG